MKLLYCTVCEDAVLLRKHTRRCECGATRGRYIDDVVALYSGPAEAFAISNTEFVVALDQRKRVGIVPFVGWAPGRDDDRFRKVDDVGS